MTSGLQILAIPLPLTAQFHLFLMTIYEALVTESKRPHSEEPNPCCEEPCDEPSFWDLLPKCRLNWIALGLAAFAIGFGLIGLGYLNIGVIINLPGVNLGEIASDPTIVAQGIRLITIFLGVIIAAAWFLFKVCSDDWKTVVVGSLIGASGFPLAAIGLLYIAAAQFAAAPPFDTTWFNISISIVVASILAFLLLAILIRINRCHVCISAKKGIVVSLIFLSAGWATWSLGRLLWTAMNTFRYAQLVPPPTFVFPADAYRAFIAVSIVNIVFALALGWYVLNCSTENCFTVFLPLFASAAPLGNWALYRVGLNVLSYIGGGDGFPPGTPLIQFAVAIGFVSITVLILTFIIANGCGDALVTAAASAIPLLYAIASYTFVATAGTLIFATPPDFVTSMLRGIFSGIAITIVLVFLLRCRAKCLIPRIIYGLGAGVFGWAIIYLYSTYSSNYLDSTLSNANSTTLNIGLTVIITAAIIAVIFIRFVSCDELVNAVTFTNFALLTAGAGGLIGTIAYYQNGRIIPPLAAVDIRAAVSIYVIYVLLALILPNFFVKCGGVKRQLVIAITSLAFGIAAIDLGRAIVFARAVAFSSSNIGNLDFTPLVYIASAIGAVLAGQVIVWSYFQANVYTALIADAVGVAVNGITPQIIFFVTSLNNVTFSKTNTGLIGVPWLIFTLAIVGLLLFLEIKSLCIQQHCRFLIGLLIPVFGIAVFGKVAGASAAFGTAFNPFLFSSVSFLPSFAYTSRLILVNSIIPLVGFFVSLRAFKCTNCLAYLPSSITFIAVIYVTSQFETADVINWLAPATDVYLTWWPLLNLITSVYMSFDLSSTDPTIISNNATFITQVSLIYILFLSPALIAAIVLSCSRPVSAAILGTAIAATTIGFGAFGISNVVAGVLGGAAGFGTIFGSITFFNITFAQFLEGIRSQFILFAIGVATAVFIFFDKCNCPC